MTQVAQHYINSIHHFLNQGNYYYFFFRFYNLSHVRMTIHSQILRESEEKANSLKL